MILDAHTHIGLAEGEARVTDVLAMLDAHGVQRAITFPAVSGLTGSPRQMAIANDYVAEAARQAPDRLIGFGTINPYHEEEGWAELTRFPDLGLRGLKLHPPLQGFVLTDRRLIDPLLERATRLGLIVVIHTGLRVAGLPYVMVNLAEIKPIAQTFLDIRFVVAHMGWGGRDSRGADELARECPNVWFDTAGVNSPDLIVHVAKAGAATRILYGSDFPFLHPKVEMLRVELAEVAPDVRVSIMGGNAQRLLGEVGP
jgi:uncharacterized protein